MSTFEASVAEENGIIVLKLSGEARLSVENLERKTLQLMAARPERVVVDLSEVEYLSSLAMGTLVQLFRSMKAHEGTVVLAEAKPRILDVLKHARLDTLFEMSDTVAGAVGRSE